MTRTAEPEMSSLTTVCRFATSVGRSGSFAWSMATQSAESIWPCFSRRSSLTGCTNTSQLMRAEPERRSTNCVARWRVTQPAGGTRSCAVRGSAARTDSIPVVYHPVNN